VLDQHNEDKNQGWLVVDDAPLSANRLAIVVQRHQIEEYHSQIKEVFLHSEVSLVPYSYHLFELIKNGDQENNQDNSLDGNQVDALSSFMYVIAELVEIVAITVRTTHVLVRGDV